MTKSQWQPLSDKLVVRRQEKRLETDEGILLTSTSQEAPYEGTVISVGDQVKTVSAGDLVLFSRWAGSEVQVGGEGLLLLCVEDIWMRQGG